MFILMTLIQIIICNFCHFGAFVLISVLPVSILCLPVSVGVIPSMLIAFVTGLSVDWLSEGILGLNALALVPVAAFRYIVISLVMGKEYIVRGEHISFRKNGIGKISIAILISLSLFLAVYVVADAAGSKPFWFIASRFSASLAANFIVSLVAASTLLPNEKR